jgi:glycosyltransferase involved in cell wall biosynthesis
MRTIHLLRKYNPDEWGGTETAIQRLFDGLRENGVTPVVYCPRVDNCRHDDPLVRSGHSVQRFKAFVPVIGMSQSRKRQLVSVGGNLMSFDLISSLWREDEVSVIHTHALGRIGAIARTVARQKQVPFVVTIHGGVFDLPQKIKESFNAPVTGGWEWGKLFGFLFQSHRLFADSDAILTCNSNEAARIKERFPEKRVVVQPHGVPLPMYQRDHRASALEAFPQIKGKKMLLAVGRIDPIKNQHWLLEQAPEIFRKHPDSLLVLAGPCTDEPYGLKVNEMIKALGLEDRVLLTGGLPSGDPRLLGLMQLADVLLLPSLSETFGLVLLESWAAGTTVISSRTSGSCALVEDGENGWLFDLDQPATFHRALDITLADVDRRAAMACRGLEKVRDHYSVGAVARQMKDLYEELIEEKQCVT